jgi:hypothetical protein
MLRIRTPWAAFGGLLLSLAAGRAFAVVCPVSAPCPLGVLSGQECRVDVECTLPSSAPYPVYDFGARRLVVNKQITVQGDGVLQVVAESILFGSSGSIRAGGAGMGAQRLELMASGDIALPTGSVLDVSTGVGSVDSPGSGGLIDVRGATVQIAGKLLAHGTNRDTYGGYVNVEATGDLSIGLTDVSGGDRAGGGEASFYAAGSMAATGPIKCQGLEGGGLTIDVGGDVVTSSVATIQLQATGADGSGGSLDAYAGGSVTIGGELSGKGLEDEAFDGEPAQSGGDGADVTIEAATGSVVLNANMDMSGAPSGYGGDLDVSADGDVTIAGKMELGTSGVYGAGSSLTDVEAGRDLTISQEIDASSPGLGGELTFFAPGTVTITSTAKIKVDGSNDPFVGGAGSLFIEGDCAVNVAGGALLSATGAGEYPFASNEIWASDLTIGGTVRAGAENRFDYRTIHLLPTATLVPAVPPPPPSQTAPCCGDCPTTTTLPLPTTTTTAPPTTTSTSSSSTTSTAPPATTSTTTTTTASTSTAPTSTTTVTSTTTLASSTTTTEATPTTVTTTSSPALVSTTIGASTTTTAVGPTPTTSTTMPEPGAECIRQPDGVDAASCRIDVLAETLGTTSPDVLGGKGSARRLGALLERANRFLDLAEGGTKTKANLRRARRKLKAFEKTVERGLKRKRGAIDGPLGEFILGLARDATNDVGVAQSKLR